MTVTPLGSSLAPAIFYHRKEIECKSSLNICSSTLEAVRRGMRHQDLEPLRAASDGQRTFYHGLNSRRDREIFQPGPKHTAVPIYLRIK